MGFIKKLFSSDHRAARSAEASLDFELAAERYALSKQFPDAVRMHLARAERAKNRGKEIEALRDALYWAQKSADGGITTAQASKALGKALLAQAQAEGVETEADHKRVQEAAQYLLAGHCFEHAGDAYTSIGDDKRAAHAYRSGGLVAKMERALGRSSDKIDRRRSEHHAFADYDLHMHGGARDAALQCLRDCLTSAEQSGRYRRLADELESRMITNGRVVLKRRQGTSLSLSAADEILIGRDALCDMVLRSGGVSRRHASISMVTAPTTQWLLSDAGSRNGTRLGGLAIADQLALVGNGTFQLGPPETELVVHFSAKENTLRLDIQKGLDTGAQLLSAPETVPISLSILDIDTVLVFERGRPFIKHPGKGTQVVLDGESLAHGDIQLIHGDVVSIGGIELQVG